MATFGELKQRVARRLQDANNTAVSDPEVGDAINAAIRYWKQERFFFNKISTTVTTTQGSAILPLSNVLYLDKDYGVSLPYQGMTYNLYPVSPDYYNALNVNSPGRPYCYTYKDGSYYLYWIPDQAYTLNISGVEDYPDLINPSDTNDFTINADQLIMYEALSRAGQLREAFQENDYYVNGAISEANSLKKRGNLMEASGTMRIEYDKGPYDRYGSWI